MSTNLLASTGDEKGKEENDTKETKEFYLALEDLPPRHQVLVTFIRDNKHREVSQKFVSDTDGKCIIDMKINHPLPHGKYSVSIELLGHLPMAPNVEDQGGVASNTQ